MSKTEEPEVSYGPTPIQTPQDAAVAFLRGQIDEDKLREVCDKFGVLPGQLFPVWQERPDAAFENTIPDDILLPAPAPKDDIETRLKAAEEKEKVREEARKADPNYKEPKAEKPKEVTPAEAPKPLSTSKS